MAKIYTTPGVYIEEKNAFPNSVVAVSTSVPAFVGYTEKATRNNQELAHQAIRISSFGEFLQYFGEAPKITYGINKTDDKTGFQLVPDSTRFLLFNSLQFFYANGGSDCYIVSIGNYQSIPHKAHFFGHDDKNQSKGLTSLLKEQEPTMVVIPDALLLEELDCQSVQIEMLKHCGLDMKNRVAILDVYNGYLPRTVGTKDIIDAFRDGIGSDFLSFGMAYYPWCHTTITEIASLSFQNISVADFDSLVEILNNNIDQDIKAKNLDAKRGATIKEIVTKITTLGEKSNKPLDEETKIKELHQMLLSTHPLYKFIITSIAEKVNLLPPAAAMAGIYTMIDNNVGVFQSPANVSLGSVVTPVVNISKEEQDDLNVPLNGKAVNAIRAFPGKEVLVWGARTLDGNSMDWRYISIRRTVIMIEQSVKNAIAAYVFAPNTAATWENIEAMLNNFLTNLWKQGVLAGAMPEGAFSIDIGLGRTMTPVDMLEGILRITVKLAVTRPAEFIVLTFEQQMQKP